MFDNEFFCKFEENIFFQIEKMELEGATLIDVPGYEQPVEFGVLVYFAYPVENSGKYFH